MGTEEPTDRPTDKLTEEPTIIETTIGTISPTSTESSTESPAFRIPPTQSPLFRIPPTESPAFRIPPTENPAFRIPPTENPAFQTPTETSNIFDQPQPAEPCTEEELAVEDDQGPWPCCLGLTGEECEVYIEGKAPDLTEVSIILEGSVVTTDFVTTRVRIYVDENGIVTLVPRRG